MQSAKKGAIADQARAAIVGMGRGDRLEQEGAIAWIA
jgi:hypothetical protein